MKTDLFPTEDVDEVVGKNERGRIAVDQATRGPLDVAQEVPEIDVEQVSVLLDHDVIVVPVRDAEHVRRHAAPGARAQEVVGRLAVPAIIRERSINRRHVYTKQTAYLHVLLLPWVLVLQPVGPASCYELASFHKLALLESSKEQGASRASPLLKNRLVPHTGRTRGVLL